MWWSRTLVPLCLNPTSWLLMQLRPSSFVAGIELSTVLNDEVACICRSSFQIFLQDPLTLSADSFWVVRSIWVGWILEIYKLGHANTCSTGILHIINMSLRPVEQNKSALKSRGSRESWWFLGKWEVVILSVLTGSTCSTCSHCTVGKIPLFGASQNTKCN